MNQYTLSQLSLTKSSSGYEFQVANLFSGAGSTTSTSVGMYITGPGTTAGSAMNLVVGNGGTSSLTSYIPPATMINTVSPSVTYYFEANFGNNTTYTAFVGLWDATSNALVSGSTISTSNNQITLRSSPITLVAGHKYYPVAWSSSGGTAYLYTARIVGQV